MAVSCAPAVFKLFKTTVVEPAQLLNPGCGSPSKLRMTFHIPSSGRLTQDFPLTQELDLALSQLR